MEDRFKNIKTSSAHYLDPFSIVLTTKEIPLTQLRPNESGVVIQLLTSESIQFKLFEMGLTPGELVTYIRSAPLGDPIEIQVLNFRMALRRSEADKIFVKRITSKTNF